MDKKLFPELAFVSSDRIIYTPSAFARSSLIHLQETGTLQALVPHKSERNGLASYLFFTVFSGRGKLSYGDKVYELCEGDCVFIDCRKAYSHETGFIHKENADASLWALQWCHFYGPNMNSIYRKYSERGGRPVFRTQQLDKYHTVLTELHSIAGSADHVRDMRIHEKLSSLLVLLMEDAWDSNISAVSISRTETHSVDIQAVKEYLDLYYMKRITLDDLSELFYINKYYLLKLFKERYGVTINVYLNQMRITYVKQQLRFTDKTVEMLSSELQVEASYLSRLFKKVEGVSPTQYRRLWRG